MSGLQGIMGLLAPPPFVFEENYSGLEFRWKNLAFRPAMFVKEGLILGIVALLLVAYYLGKSMNQRRAKAWWKIFHDQYSPQFKAMSPLPSQPLISNGPATYLHYLTGRRNLLSLHMALNLLPRHNFIQLIQDLVFSVIDPVSQSAEDEIVLDFTLGENGKGQLGEGPGVWAVVDKSGVLTSIRKQRWDVTFTKGAEYPTLPNTHMVLTETADSSDFILKANNIGLIEALKDPRTAKWFKSLVITDQPSKRPSKGPVAEGAKSRHLVLTLRLPAESQMQEATPWIQIALNLVDMMAKNSVKPETTRKLKKVRADVDQELAREYQREVQEETGETEEEKRAAKRRAEEKRRALLSPEEQRRLEEKERKKAQKKVQGRTSRR
ncbi:hypothetical protein QFC22_001311 [Naganishia vaughanmartiniae]|uniref:Uncharacterized protein n=1 Tax=Naganishia vaughanmartiniae TaxID=1424756 RepID=A0ACC2XIA0_9TREE|nr:hypothetical protein QFC22_001311 [Naganishia vaughanmartiniae]